VDSLRPIFYKFDYTDWFHQEVGMKQILNLAVFWLVLAALALSGCVAPTTFKTEPNLVRGTGELRVLLMPVDVELSELSAGGVSEPNAEWTAKAKKHIVASIEKTFLNNESKLIRYKEPPGGTDVLHPHVQLVKLHQAVGGAIITHKINPIMQLPNKTGVFDWSLGDGVKQLREEFGADYAMFLFVRDSYTSGGRAVAMVLAAVLGVGIPGGRQLGYASLVNLRTGELVWFNFLVRGQGDLRASAEAAESMSVLLKDLPK
jgi:hypothetical protein